VRGQQETCGTVREILVCDGGSTDGTYEFARQVADVDDRVRTLSNLGRTVPCGLNLAIARMAAPVLVRVDSHAVLEPDYVDNAIRELQRTEADVLGGGIHPVGVGQIGSAVAWALQHPIGTGGGAFHRPGRSGPVESVYMGVFPVSTFGKYGLFDEEFTRNQDDEFTYRVRARGGLVYLSTELKSRYEPRGSVRAVLKQYFQYGVFKPLVLRKHFVAIRARHLAPTGAVLVWVLGLLGVRKPVALSPLCLYLGAVAIATRDRSWRTWLARVAVVLSMHSGYGLGFALTLLGLSGKLRSSLRPRPSLGVDASSD
jgi:succinoglycan biosynthesis protein ExoA